MFAKLPLGLLLLCVGGVLTLVGFVAYATGNATLNLAGLFYGIPILLGGLALKAAELKPVPYIESPSEEISALRQQQATSTQQQIIKDVTRYRYGQQAHLDESLQRLGLSPTDEERPDLIAIGETQTNGDYTLVLQFDSPMISLATWEEKREKIEKFFGPDIRVEVTQPEEELINLLLIKA